MPSVMLYKEHYKGLAVDRPYASDVERKRVAVIGSGISGLSAAWLLSKTMPVTLYESERQLGGHSNTVSLATESGNIPVDTGFIVYNERNYPNLVALFNETEVATQESDMSFAVSLDGGAMEYSGSGLNGLIGQRGNIIRPRFWSMMRDVMRFYRDVPSVLTSDIFAYLTLGEYLDQHGYGDAFIDDHLLPMGAAIWSASAKEMRSYPLIAFVRFFVSHGLLSLNDRPQWRTVKGGSRNYVDRLARDVSGGIRINTKVVAIARKEGQVFVTDSSGNTDCFTDVIIATHADQALGMLIDADNEENYLLGAFKYTENQAYLHSDVALMPKRKRIWSSWNYIGQKGDDGGQSVCVTYWMNRLQNIDPRHPLFVTLNPTRDIASDRVFKTINYKHPLFDVSALNAQRRLWQMQGKRNTWFCGAYFGYGFHEDGLQAGLAAAEGLAGVKRPWRVGNESSRITLPTWLMAAE